MASSSRRRPAPVPICVEHTIRRPPPPNFDYRAPQSVAEAVALLEQHPDAKILAGGHSLIPPMKFRLAAPALLVDINRIADLGYIREDDGWLKIGTLPRESDLDHSELIRERYLCWPEA